MKLMAHALEEDRHATYETLSRATGIPETSVFRILTNDLNKRRTSARWVPHCWTAEQKQKFLDIATLLKEGFDIEDQEFLRRIVAIDNTWIRDFEPVLKTQSNEWRSIGSPRTKKKKERIDELNQRSSK